MKKALKIILSFIIIITLICASIWYYVTSKVTHIINDQYAAKDIVILSIKNTSVTTSNNKLSHLIKGNQDHMIRFSNATAYGAPYKIAWNLNNFIEESPSAYMEYLSPIKFGYDILTQKLFIHYDGVINASYKPINSGFGSKLVIKDYNIEVFLPLSFTLIHELSKSNDISILLNYIDNISLSNDNVSIFDLVDKEKFYEKEYETAHIKFTNRKKYVNLEDFLNNIPQHYNITYDIKTAPNDKISRIVPASLFYGLMLIPSGNKIALDIDINTKANNYHDFKKGLTVNSHIKSDSPYLEIHNLDSHYRTTDDELSPQYYWKKNLIFTIKQGFFDEIIKLYHVIMNSYPIERFAPKFHQQMLYLIKNKQHLNLDELENNKYQVNLDTNWKIEGKLLQQHLNDLTLSSDYSAVKLKHNFTYSLKNHKWQLKGIGYINNYPSVIEYFSSYFYNISNYRNLGPEVHKLYIDANKDFAKIISDHPHSKSNDLSFEYDIDSTNYSASKFGSMHLLEIAPLYTVIIYQKLLNKVGHEGDILSKMKKIIPTIDENEPILKNILSNASLTKVLQTKSKEQDRKPKENIGQELFKKFMK
ncbi:MAG: hypothetical protein H6909_03340 [Rickettsiaceae bacterium]|nr:hypothetical protein [Rickettsiaceae bacterium]